MRSLIRSVTFDMLAVRIFNESDHLTHAQVLQIMRTLQAKMIECILSREPLELEGIGTFTLREQRVDFVERVCCRVQFTLDKKLKDSVTDNVAPDGRYISTKFTPDECDEIRRKILSGEATIKGTARALNAAVKTIQKIVRNVPTQTQEPEQEDEDE